MYISACNQTLIVFQFLSFFYSITFFCFLPISNSSIVTGLLAFASVFKNTSSFCFSNILISLFNVSEMGLAYHALFQRSCCSVKLFEFASLLLDRKRRKLVRRGSIGSFRESSYILRSVLCINFFLISCVCFYNLQDSKTLL